MKIRVPLLLSLLVVAAMAALSAWAWAVIPGAARIAVHFDASGVPNGFDDKRHALLMLPLMALGLTVLLSAIPFIEPRRMNLAASAKFYKVVWVGVILVLAFAHTSVVLTALHVPVDISHTTTVAVALLFIVIGNYLGKTRSNFFAGVRTPWTLSSDYSWEKTHRLTGRLFMLTGAATLIACFALPPTITAAILFGGAIASSLIGIGASYLYWRRDPSRHSSDSRPE
jgi:uncharacterized membrane protein